MGVLLGFRLGGLFASIGCLLREGFITVAAEHEAGTGGKGDEHDNEMGGLHAHEEVNPAENLDDQDGEPDPGQRPGPALLGIVEEGDQSDEEGDKENAHGSRLPGRAAAAQETGEPAKTARLHVDGVKEEIERDRAEEEPEPKLLQTSRSATGLMHVGGLSPVPKGGKESLPCDAQGATF